MMKRVLPLLLALSSYSAYAIELHPGDILVDGDEQFALYRIDPESGVATGVSIAGGPYVIKGIAILDSDNAYFTAGRHFTSGSGELFHWNPRTGATTSLLLCDDFNCDEFFQPGGVLVEAAGTLLVGANGITVPGVDFFWSVLVRIDPVSFEKELVSIGGSGGGGLRNLVLGPDGWLLAAMGFNGVSRIHPITGERRTVTTINTGLSGIALGPDGTIYVSTDQSMVYAINPDNGDRTLLFECEDLPPDFATFCLIGDTSLVWTVKDKLLFANGHGLFELDPTSGGVELLSSRPSGDALAIVPGTVTEPPRPVEVIQLTNNSVDDQVSGSIYSNTISGSHVVWRSDASGGEIHVWDGATVTPIPGSSWPEGYCGAPYISGPNVAWASGYDCDVLFWDGATTTQVSDTLRLRDGGRLVISGPNVFWTSEDVPDDGNLNHGGDLLRWDGASITQLTHSSSTEFDLVASGTNVGWTGYGPDAQSVGPALVGPPPAPATYGVFLWNAGGINQITPRPGYDACCETDLAISGSNAVWTATPDSGGGHQIYLWDGATITQITNNPNVGYWPAISGTRVVWSAYDGEDSELYLWDGATITQITNNTIDDWFPAVSGRNVVWYGSDGSNSQIYLWDGSTTTQLTTDTTDHRPPKISGSTVVWSGFDGHDDEIYMARLVPEPSQYALILAAFGTLACLRLRKGAKRVGDSGVGGRE